jgi:tRNA threonylcarbamoyladenosine biosynthesis protein TsaE
MQKFLIKSEEEMADLAAKIAQKVQPKSVICLTGTLGAGKSFFARNFINSLQEQKEEVPSPTFNLVNSFDSQKGELFHFDLYRLENPDELENIGFFDAIKNSICLIEWPQIAKDYLKNTIEIEIKLTQNTREVYINGI